MKISATIISLNEEEHLGRCLQSIQGVVDEIVVVDSGSSDQTLDIAATYGAIVLKRHWTNYSDQKNFAASKASHDWILSLDADECFSALLREEVSALKSREATAEAFEFPRLAQYLGRWIHHSGWYPDYKVRLYLRTKAHWEGKFVHESLVVEGRIGRLKGDLLHYTCDSVSDHLNRINRYTTLAAQDLWERGKRSSMANLVGSPPATFLKSYFFESGFRDGIHGCLIASFAGYYNFLKYAKLWELERKAASNS
jgi:glycosyltransferase involved in cell wall biosynthesis